MHPFLIYYFFQKKGLPCGVNNEKKDSYVFHTIGLPKHEERISLSPFYFTSFPFSMLFFSLTKHLPILILITSQFLRINEIFRAK